MTKGLEIHQPHIASRKIKHKGFLITLVTFVFLITLIIYFAFYNNPVSNDDERTVGNKITGFVAKETEEEKIRITADLTVPNLEISLKTSQIEIITISPRTTLLTGEEKLDLSEIGKTEIILLDFNGKISFDGSSILSLNGRATKLLMNGIPTTPQTGSTMKISFSDAFLYNSVEIDEISLRSLEYTTSGTIKINDDSTTIRLSGEEVKINGYRGKLRLRNEILTLNGEVDKIGVSGKLNLNIY